MSIVHPKSQWQWLLLLLLSFVLVHAFETPRETMTSATTTTPPPATTQCQHDSIPDLIKSSPVILKALGARIFTDYDSYPFQDDIEITEELILKAQQQQRRDVPAAAVLEAAAASRRSSSSWSRSSSNHLEDDDNEDDDVSFSVEDSVFASAGSFDGASEWAAAVSFDAESGSDRMSTTTTSKSTLIALTPMTIYKGASLLKITQQPDGMSRESSYQYEEQLNATLEPLACFDSNILKLLPTEIIAFGKLVSDQRPDVLRISINGLHRWSPQFENRIWKYLGWDDWSDFTLCSVQCGKGVQQRFRRCLLDNPMININMNNNNNNNMNRNDMQQKQQPKQEHQDAVDVSSSSSVSRSSSSSRSSSDSSPSNVPNQAKQHHYQHHQHHHHQQKQQKQQNKHHQQQQPLLSLHSRGSISSSSRSNSGNGSSRSRNHSTSPEKDPSSNMSNETKSTTSGGQWGIDGVAVETAAASTDSVSLNKLKKRRKRKKAKSLSTMSCEGYNIEQRNCNTFECTDDISDLLKFYKKFLPLEELPTTLVPQQQSESTMLVQQQQQMPTVSEMAFGGGGGATSSSFFPSSFSSSSSILGSSVPAAAAATVAVSSPPSTASTTLLPNTGYIRSWKNSLNFTLMITLRLKNDTKSTSTVFSIRNITHNLYVETSANGLRLLQERDNATEMLPVKFQLYDNRWHQVSISFQNGDFISIYVDCTWTNSFVVSKRLFSLPNDADVEIGRGFSGELQQILVLPDNQERHQCSNVRTSINEVKRYIIDTFIDDYGN